MQTARLRCDDQKKTAKRRAPYLERSVPIQPVLFPGTFVPRTVWGNEYALATPLIPLPAPLIPLPICTDQMSRSVHLTVQELTSVLATVCPLPHARPLAAFMFSSRVGAWGFQRPLAAFMVSSRVGAWGFQCVGSRLPAAAYQTLGSV